MNRAIHPIVHFSIDMQESCHRYLGEDCSRRLTQKSDRFTTVLRGWGVPTVHIGYVWGEHGSVKTVGDAASFDQPYDPFLTAIRDGDMVCYKGTPNAMVNPFLCAELEQWRTRRAIVTGVFVPSCVGLTALGILAMEGVRCVIPVDLVSCQLLPSPDWDGDAMYADYDTQEFRKQNRKEIRWLAERHKSARAPGLTTSDRVLNALAVKLFSKAKRAAPKGRPSFRTQALA